MLKTRIIPVLLLSNRGLYKGVKFKKHQYIGDPLNTIRIFNDKGVDELIILDIEASIKKKPIDFDYLSEIVSEAFIPISYGGGIKTIDDAKRLFSIGIEKIIINTCAFERPLIISELSERFGSQSIVVSIDVKKDLRGASVYMLSGTKRVNLSLEEASMLVEKLGAGEIIINDIDRDGTLLGYNLDYVRRISEKVAIPIVICGGAKDIYDFRRAKDAGAQACGAGAMFVYHGRHKAVLISYPRYDELRSILGE